MTFQQVVQQYFGSVRPVTDDEVNELKCSMSAEVWRAFVSEVRSAQKKAA